MTISAERQTAQDRLIEDWARHVSSHALEQLLSLFTDDVVYEDVATGIVNHGKNEVRAFFERNLASVPDVTFELTSKLATGTKGGAEWVMRGTHRGDEPGMPAMNKPVEVRGASIFEFADGKIRRCADYYDVAVLLRQLGQMPSGA